MKILERNKTHIDGRSHDMILAEHKKVKLKLTYEAYNAVERYTVETIDGLKLNHVLSMLDLGEVPNSSAYGILSPEKREGRANDLYKRAVVCIEKMF